MVCSKSSDMTRSVKSPVHCGRSALWDHRGTPRPRATLSAGRRNSMGRVAIVAGCWFALWMALGSLVGGLTAGGHGGVQNGIYFGLFHGAWIAALTSFAWPWIMPESLARWM